MIGLAAVIAAGATAALGAPALAQAAGPALTVSNVSCAASGYSFTVGGSGFPAGAALYVFFADNVYTGTGQFVPATVDQSGSFSVVDNVAGVGQNLPVTVTVGDKSYLRSGGTSGTLFPPSVTVIPPDCSLLTATPPATSVGGTSTIGLQTINPSTGASLGASGAGRQVQFSTTLGTFPGGCTTACPATDNGDGTYTLPLTSGTAGTAVVTASINDPAYGRVTVKNQTSVVFAGPPPAPDLAVTKTTTATSVQTGTAIPYTITVTNHGNADATAVTLADTLTGGTITSLTTAAPNTCTVGSPATTGSCSLGTIPAGGSVTVNETATASSPGTVANTATASTAAEPAATLADNTSAAPSVTVTAPPPPPAGVCNEPGEVLSGAHWKTAARHDLYVVIGLDCDYDAATHRSLIHHAFVLVYYDGVPLIAAVTDSALGRLDIQNATLNGPDAVIAGTYAGTPFTVTLHDGGRVRKGSDTVRVQYGSLDTSTLSAPHCAAVAVLD